MSKIKIAHRGYSINEKDNSIKSFEKAIYNNFDMIELDIQLCKNDKIIVFHDLFLNNKLVKDLTYEEIIKIDKDIITLEQFFNIEDINKIKIYLDIKGTGNIIKKLHQFIKNNKINCKNLYIASFNYIHVLQLNMLNFEESKIGFTPLNI